MECCGERFELLSFAGWASPVGGRVRSATAAPRPCGRRARRFSRPGRRLFSRVVSRRGPQIGTSLASTAHVADAAGAGKSGARKATPHCMDRTTLLADVSNSEFAIPIRSMQRHIAPLRFSRSSDRHRAFFFHRPIAALPGRRLRGRGWLRHERNDQSAPAIGRRNRISAGPAGTARLGNR